MNKTKEKIVVIMDLEGYLEWLWYDSDKVSLVDEVTTLMRDGCKPYAKQYTNTDQLFDGRYVSDAYVKNSEELQEKGIMKYDEKCDVHYFDKKYPIIWE